MRLAWTRPAIACLLCLAWPLAARAEVVVIVHPDNPVQALTLREVSDLYLGRSRAIGGREQGPPVPVSIYEHAADSPLREAFIRALNGMPLSQFNAYWARLRFSGEVLPPIALADSQAVLDVVRRNRSAIGYVDAAAVSGSSVKVVLRLKD